MQVDESNLENNESVRSIRGPSEKKEMFHDVEWTMDLFRMELLVT